jgi:hypothetical protein
MVWLGYPTASIKVECSGSTLQSLTLDSYIPKHPSRRHSAYLVAVTYPEEPEYQVETTAIGEMPFLVLLPKVMEGISMEVMLRCALIRHLLSDDQQLETINGASSSLIATANFSTAGIVEHPATGSEFI